MNVKKILIKIGILAAMASSLFITPAAFANVNTQGNSGWYYNTQQNSQMQQPSYGYQNYNQNYSQQYANNKGDGDKDKDDRMKNLHIKYMQMYMSNQNQNQNYPQYGNYGQNQMYLNTMSNPGIMMNYPGNGQNIWNPNQYRTSSYSPSYTSNSTASYYMSSYQQYQAQFAQYQQYQPPMRMSYY